MAMESEQLTAEEREEMKRKQMDAQLTEDEIEGVDFENVPIWECHLPPVFLPYMTIDCVVNDKNIWGNMQHLDPSLIEYDLENEEHWSPLFCEVFPESSIAEQYPIRPFFEVGLDKIRIPTPVSSARVEALEKEIYIELKVGILNWRHTRYMKTGWLPEMDAHLRNGLITYEYQDLTGIPNPLGLTAWKSDVSRVIPQGCNFVGIPIHFCYADPKKIRHYIIDHFDLHSHKSKNAKFSFGTYVCAHYGNVSSVWVYVALVTPVKEEEATKRKGASGGPKVGAGMPTIKRKW